MYRFLLGTCSKSFFFLLFLILFHIIFFVHISLIYKTKTKLTKKKRFLSVFLFLFHSLHYLKKIKQNKKKEFDSNRDRQTNYNKIDAKLFIFFFFLIFVYRNNHPWFQKQHQNFIQKLAFRDNLYKIFVV